ncbi:MAG TPA: acetyl-CoA carboxylase biotin carboxylase subunit [Gaiellaceae bacterium]|nr:acetyl-CoA carboxylase biotin carboxylase subunit [Gaiellaceae bacterium]
MLPFTKILVANRGEIAVRICRTLRELEIASVAIYSEVDRGSLHASMADEAYLVGPGTPAESYLSQERILDAAQRAGAQAVHPGYGFLAENAEFARAVEDAGLTWIGPPPEAMELMGSKVAARQTMSAAGVPIVPGTTEPAGSADEVRRLGDELGWPIAIKASAGGGGKGLKVVASPEEAERAFEAARREGEAYFSDSAVYVERYLEDPRHVEVQVLADAHGAVIHLGERDCTIQRRHQKLVEETPSPAVDEELRDEIGRIAVEAARAVGYRSAGTIEGLLSREGEYFFLEMNTRLQVEHTVTELVTGLDLVREQVLIAAGEPLWLSQDEVRLNGHAIECRINAEDPSTGFLPSPGRITTYREPAGPGVRVDSGVAGGSEVVGLYDPLAAKLCTHGVDRDHARRRMLRALGEYEIGGVKTLVGFHRALLDHPCFSAGETCRGVTESPELAERAEQLSHLTTNVPAASDGRARERSIHAEVEGRRFEVKVLTPEPPHAELARRRRDRDSQQGHRGAARDAIVTPMQGTVLAVEVSEGDEVAAGQVVCVVEAMKMENEITSPRAGTVSGLSVEPGQPVTTGQVICLVAQDEA